MRAWLRHNLQLAVVPAWVQRTMSYGVIGAVCASISNLVVVAGSFAGMKYWNTTALAFVLVTPLGYVLQSRFTFGVGLSARRFIHFAGSIAVGAALFLALIGLLHSAFGVPVWIASPLATLLIFCWNYVALSWAISSTTRGNLHLMTSSRFSAQCDSLPTTPGKHFDHG